MATARSALHSIIEDFGPGVVGEPLRLEALLRDLAFDDRRGVFLLVQTLHSGTVRTMIEVAGGSGVGYRLYLGQAVRRLEDDLGLSPDAARFAVETWASALGLPAVRAADHPVEAPSPAFRALDRDRRSLAESVEAAAELGISTTLAAAWEDVEALCAAAERAGPAGRPADDTAELGVARAAVDRFRAAHVRALDRTAAAVARLPELISDARTALQDAQASVDRAQQAGEASLRAAERIAQARAAAADLQPGAGPGACYRAAVRVRDLARQAARLVEAAPATARRVRAGLFSVPTRSAAARQRVRDLAGPLADLRSEFPDAAWTDLVGTGDRALAEITEADRAVASARRLSTEQAWDDAADEIGRARTLLTRAEEGLRAVTDRLDVLRAVRDDRASPAAEVRFAIRDARLLLGTSPAVEDRALLDAASAELDVLSAAVQGPHPDHLHYLARVHALHQLVRQLVDRVRAARRAP